MDSNPTLYEYVMAKLREKSVPQRVVARDSGVPFSTVAKIAQGSVTHPSVHTVQMLYDYFRALETGPSAAAPGPAIVPVAAPAAPPSAAESWCQGIHPVCGGGEFGIADRRAGQDLRSGLDRRQTEGGRRAGDDRRHEVERRKGERRCGEESAQ